MNSRTFFNLVCLLASILNGGLLQVFDSIWLLLHSQVIFCSDGFHGGAGKICLRIGIACCDGVTWSFFKEATLFFNRFIFSSTFCLGFCVFSLSAFDVAEAPDLGLLWSGLFFLLIWSFWAKDMLLLVSAIFCLLSFFSLFGYWSGGFKL